MADIENSESEDISDLARTGYQKLSDSMPIADFGYHTYTWPAWFVVPSKSFFVPVVRLAISDMDGTILFKREALITSVIDLIENLSSSLLKDLRFAAEFSGYSIDSGISKSDAVDSLENTAKFLLDSKKIIENIKWRDPSDEIQED